MLSGYQARRLRRSFVPLLLHHSLGGPVTHMQQAQQPMLTPVSSHPSSPSSPCHPTSSSIRSSPKVGFRSCSSLLAVAAPSFSTIEPHSSEMSHSHTGVDVYWHIEAIEARHRRRVSFLSIRLQQWRQQWKRRRKQR